jgi:glycosyltransferase involved in cell wall biosynthesis
MAPTISAIICTRNRSDSAVEAVRSVLANTHPSFELMVIDQSDGPETRHATARFLSDPRFLYMPTHTRGVGRSRNIGLTKARAPIVAFTDDDCSVPENWLEVIETCFAEKQHVTVMFTNVEAGSHDDAAGFVPTYERDDSAVISDFWSKRSARGIGASMAFRRDPVLANGGFDELMGPGGFFTSGEDVDIAIRAIALGQGVYETNRVSVVHFGYRTWLEGRALAKRDWRGIGAAYIKPLRAGYWGIAPVILNEMFVICLAKPLLPLLSLRRPQGLGRSVAFLSGLLGGLVHPMDKKRLVYLPKGEA